MSIQRVSDLFKREARFDQESRRTHTVYVAVCVRCRFQDDVRFQTNGSPPPPIAIAAKFAKAGWEMGTHRNGDVCPSCSAKKLRERKTEVIKPPANVTPINKASELPRVMSREDRRIVFEKLNEVYLDEKRGYDEGWSDAKLANDLAVPRRWVETIRDENFGPAIVEDVKQKLVIDELKAAYDAIQAAATVFETLRNGAETQIKLLKTAKDRVSAAMDAIAK